MDDLPLSPSLRARQRPDPYQGISSSPFPPEVVEVLTAALSEGDVEIKLDGLLFLPEIKYRRTLNRAFGPGGWALMPMGEILHFQVTAASPSPLATVQSGATCCWCCTHVDTCPASLGLVSLSQATFDWREVLWVRDWCVAGFTAQACCHALPWPCRMRWKVLN